MKQFCKYGHDTQVTGRDTDNSCSECRRFSQTRYRQSDKEKINIRKSDLKVFNLTPEQYEQKLQEQNGCCAICGKHGSRFKRKLAIDHDHTCCPKNESCGKCIRGLLCYSCNGILGRLENPEFIKKVRKYLKSAE